MREATVDLRYEDGAAAQRPGLTILPCTDEPRGHWSVEVNGWAMALDVNLSSPAPALVDAYGKLYIGVEQGIFTLDLKTGEVLERISEIGAVQWIEADASDRVIFAAEDELIALGPDGRLAWRKNLPDIIATTDVDGDALVITDMSENVYRLRTSDGAVL